MHSPMSAVVRVAALLVLLLILVSCNFVPACCLSLCAGGTVVVRVCAASAAGPFFPAAAVPVAWYSGSLSSSSGGGYQLIGRAVSDMYGVARLCVDSADSDAWSAHNLLSVNEEQLPHHRSQWSAERLHVPSALNSRCSLLVTLEPVALPRAVASPAAAVAVDRVSCAAVLSRSVRVLCSHLLSTSLVLPSCAVGAVAALLCARLMAAPAASSQPRVPRSIVALPSLSLCIQAAPPPLRNSRSSSSHSDSLPGAVSVCCQCSACSAAPTRSLAASRKQQQPMSLCAVPQPVHAHLSPLQ